MDTKTYTPGPWTAWDDDGTGTLPCVLSKQVTTFGNFYVAQCNVYEDARLISAAPELLEALRLLIRGWDRVRENQPKAVKRFREWAGDEDTDFMQGLAAARAAIAKAEGG